MMTPQGVTSWLAEHFEGLVAKHAVPGASVAVLAGGEVVARAAGLTSTATGVEVDTDTVFQIGSITKLWTSSLVMQLVDDGRVDLDSPVAVYLPELRIGDEAAGARVTVRQLLSHTAGFEGDIFTDTGRGADAVEKYVATLADLPQLFPPGAFFSYNNTAYVILGRLVEVLRGQPYGDVLVERLARPLDLASVSPSPYEAILHRTAVGHLPGADGSPTPAPTWALAASNAPAGSMLAMTPTDLVGFARMHLVGGTAADGSVLLRPETVTAMRSPQVRLPRLTGMGSAWGLGFELIDTPSGTVVGHDGGTIGQAAFLRMVPDAGVAVALLTNGGDVFGLYLDVVAELVEQLTGVRLPGLPEPPAQRLEIDPTPYLGRYADTIYDVVVSRDDDGTVWLDRTPKDVIAELGEEPFRTRLVPFEPGSMISAEPTHGIHVVFSFLGEDGSGRASYVHYGRVIARVG